MAKRRWYMSSADIPAPIPFPTYPRRRGPGRKHKEFKYVNWDKYR